jgi:hypothetical protein
MQAINLTANLGQLLAQMPPELISRLQMTLTLAAPVDDSFPECLPRHNFQHYLHLIGARVGAEIGVQKGIFSEHLLANWPGKLHLVDIWAHQESGYVDYANVDSDRQEEHYLETLCRVERFGERALVIKEYSVLAADMFKDNELCFVYLDANHSFEGCMEDLEAWFPKVRPGGLIAGHDFIDLEEPGLIIQVKKAVTRFVGGRWPIYVSRDSWPSLWYFVKR